MKKILLCVSIFASCGTIFASHHHFEKVSSCSKHYVQAGQVVLSDDGILILGDTDLVVSGIFYDENGLYFLEDGVQWICRNCGAFNSLDDFECYRCHEPR